MVGSAGCTLDRKKEESKRKAHTLQICVWIFALDNELPVWILDPIERDRAEEHLRA